MDTVVWAVLLGCMRATPCVGGFAALGAKRRSDDVNAGALAAACDACGDPDAGAYSGTAVTRVGPVAMVVATGAPAKSPAPTTLPATPPAIGPDPPLLTLPILPLPPPCKSRNTPPLPADDRRCWSLYNGLVCVSIDAGVASTTCVGEAGA